VDATVPVNFRVTTDVAKLSSDPPQLSVVVEAIPRSLVQIDDRTLSVDASGKLTVLIDMTTSLLGTSSNIVSFERKLNYVITETDGTVTRGSLATKTGITPLEIQSPGFELITQTGTFTLSGRTSPRAKITANGYSFTANDNGTFRQDMVLSAPGTTQLRVRAEDKGLTPRLVNISLERVTNLRTRANELDRTFATDYDSIVERVTEEPNSLVAIHGEVVAQQSSGPATVLIISAKCLRTPCLVSVRHGAPLSLKRGIRIIAIGRGRLTKKEAEDARDLAVDASLVIEEPR
jgi:hypothetical protein